MQQGKELVGVGGPSLCGPCFSREGRPAVLSPASPAGVLLALGGYNIGSKTTTWLALPTFPAASNAFTVIVWLPSMNPVTSSTSD